MIEKIIISAMPNFWNAKFLEQKEREKSPENAKKQNNLASSSNQG
jgi:hypothetical protein